MTNDEQRIENLQAQILEWQTSNETLTRDLKNARKTIASRERYAKQGQGAVLAYTRRSHEIAYLKACRRWAEWAEDNLEEDDFYFRGSDRHLLESFVEQVKTRWGSNELGQVLEILLEKNKDA